MTSVSLRGMFGRKLRTVLTALAILLGVAMVAGTFVMTDSIRKAFDTIFTEATKGTSAAITGKTAVDSQTQQTPPLPQSLVAQVRRVDGVAAAEGAVNGTAQFLDSHDKVIGGGGAPTIAFSIGPDPAHDRFNSLALIAGTWPRHGQIMVDQATAKSQHWQPGTEVRVSPNGGLTRRFRISGVVQFAKGVSSLGATLAIFDLPTAQRLLNRPHQVDTIIIAARSGVSQAQLVKNIRAAHLKSAVRLDIKTGEQSKSDQEKGIRTFLSFFTYILLSFGGIALFVGAFIIFNTFSITVAQRTREFALLRTLGASRRQILRTVLLEALVIGICSSLIGLGCGFLIAKGLLALFANIGSGGIPNSGEPLAARTVLAALGVGILVTIFAGLAPALRATRVAPIEALREGATLPPSRFTRRAPVIAGVLGAFGVGGLLFGVLGNPGSTAVRLLLIGGASISLFFAVATISPRLVPSAVWIMRWPLDRLGMMGRLAGENAARNPTRTAVTSAALMIGLALVAFVTIFAQGIKTSTDQAIDRSVAGDFIVTPKGNGGPATFASSVERPLTRVPGISAVSPVTTENARVDGRGTHVAFGIDPATFGDVYRFEWTDGSDAVLKQLGADGALMEKTVAKHAHLSVGSAFTITPPRGGHTRLVLRGTYKDTTFATGLLMPRATFARAFDLHQDSFIVLAKKHGAATKPIEAAIKRDVLSSYPTLQVQTRQELKAQSEQQVNQLLTLLYALLAMSVLISVFGIVNTLVLSVFERTRELGMLRAIGTSRRQVRRLVRYESVITSILGAVLGLVVGTFLAWVVTLGLSSQGLVFSLPYGQLAIFLLFAIIIGVLAAVLPARRASRINVLEALSYE